MISIIVWSIVAVLLLLTITIGVKKSFFTVKQGTVSIITRWGKFLKISTTGLNLKIPFIDKIADIISLQNRSVEMAFQAVTIDQAGVHFKAMLLFSVADTKDETIKNVAFKFRSPQEFHQALTRTIEGSIRAFVAKKKQAEILQLRTEIVSHVKTEIDNQLSEWGYHLQDLQINDITFGGEITKAMEAVVTSLQNKTAAENNGQALLIQKTKEAEANGTAIKISAQAEKEAAQLRGEGIALFRQEVAKGMSEAAKSLEASGLDTNIILFSMWTDAIKEIAEKGKGNVMFFDGSTQGMENIMKQMQGLMIHQKNDSAEAKKN